MRETSTDIVLVRKESPVDVAGIYAVHSGSFAFQAIEFLRGSVPTTGGRVRYSPEFATLGV